MGFIGTLMVLALLALLVVYLVKRAKGTPFGPGAPRGQHPHHRPPMPPALQILDERLANGEIEVEDYMTRKAALLGSNAPAANEWTPPGRAPEPPKTDGPTDDPVI
jgi:uncharacterized membrane protein